MQETERMGQQIQEQAKRVGQAVERGFEAASRSFSEINSGFQAVAAEMTDFSRRRFEDVAHTWDQLLHVRSFGDIVEVQSRHVQKACNAYMSETSKIGEMFLETARKAARPVDETPKRFT